MSIEQFTPSPELPPEQNPGVLKMDLSRDVQVIDPAQEVVYAPYGRSERSLGVAVDRASATSEDRERSPTSNSCTGRGTEVVIDIESDSRLRGFLDELKEKVERSVEHEPPVDDIDLAGRIVGQVLEQTPRVDETDEYHDARKVTLGTALALPVLCIDRALAMEAGLKMFGFDDARVLSSIDSDDSRIPGEFRTVGAHADVWFTRGDETYAAVTMGEYAGSVMTLDQYTGQYLPHRKDMGWGRRKIDYGWSQDHYFTALPPQKFLPEYGS